MLSDDQLRAMLAACKGPRLMDKRDEALIRLMTETGARAGEILALGPSPTSNLAAAAPRHRTASLFLGMLRV